MENQAPLPQPTPHTCPNCGAGLMDLPDFCPRCGEKGARKPARVPLSAVSTVFLSLGVLIFGAIGACGGLVAAPTLVSGAATDSESRGIMMAMLVISLPCLVVGLLGFILCLRTLIRGGKR